MNIGFERIAPTPAYPPGTSAAALARLSWESRANVAIAFRDGLKVALRATQLGRCCFCRRHLYDNYATHLEHFIDKGTFPQFRYEILNLALSCGTCNIKKNAHFATWDRRYRFITRNFVGPVPARCPGHVPRDGVSPQPGQAETHVAQRATADSRVGKVSQRVCNPSSCM